MEIVISLILTRLSNFIIIRGMADVLVTFFNSTLNQFFAVNLKAFLLLISNIQGKYVTLSQAMYTKLVL